MIGSDDIELQGIAYTIFDQFNNLIEFELSKKEYMDFYTTYFRRCLIENPNGEFTETRYGAARALSAFYRELANDASVNNVFLTKIRSMLKQVYCDGGEDIKLSIVNGVLEHLFVYDSIRQDFENWKHDKCLRKAYKDASAWSGG